MGNKNYRIIPKSVDPKEARKQELEEFLSEAFFDDDDYLANPEEYEPLRQELEKLTNELDPDPFNFTDEELDD